MNATIVSDSVVHCELPEINFWKGLLKLRVDVGLRLGDDTFLPGHKESFILRVMLKPTVLQTTQIFAFPNLKNEHKISSARYIFSVFGRGFPVQDTYSAMCIFSTDHESKGAKQRRLQVDRIPGVCLASKNCYCLNPTFVDDSSLIATNITFQVRFVISDFNTINYIDTEPVKLPVSEFPSFPSKFKLPNTIPRSTS